MFNALILVSDVILNVTSIIPPVCVVNVIWPLIDDVPLLIVTDKTLLFELLLQLAKNKHLTLSPAANVPAAIVIV